MNMLTKGTGKNWLYLPVKYRRGIVDLQFTQKMLISSVVITVVEIPDKLHDSTERHETF